MNESETASGIAAEEILKGLQRPQKSLPSKYFYDERGSELFEQICSLPEYYPTRTEISILTSNMSDISRTIGKGIDLVEFGSGSSLKTRMLLDHLKDLHVYYPVDISEAFLMKSADQIRSEYKNLNVIPVPADYTEPFSLPGDLNGERTIIFFPGSTIGNFRPDRASGFLKQHRPLMLPGGGILIGVDRKKPKEILERAYNDEKGVTAEFNLNILNHLNDKLDAAFDPRLFRHKAFYNEEEGRIEMHLVCRADHEVELSGVTVSFMEGESIHTENSYKYSPDEVEALFGEGYRLEAMWSDPDKYFSVYYFRV
ncbi:L-histidine N(alpha)-methyltransferase [Rhodohalobacter mucosus]|uniref:L-histidine N(Alpha)-methyltransferase n=1 Tax=Rhodohalobacter mucosus TaxID=2079485 RepID=A0A316TSQ3_9BACT|nr:L-histidine N(alpha)-methyltransferase [Rhodohalobacter mucosus]PWN06898.1 L-histidine N(alpha)-methyltransferase [Rhodohalobacter mucosus]